MVSTMQHVIAWFGWGKGIGALAGISTILTVVAIFAPVIAGYMLFALERLQIKILGQFNRSFAYFFVNYVTFPGTFVHEMAHLCFAVITGAHVTEICMFESGNGQLGHISLRTRGPWFMRAIQDSLTSVAPTIVGFTLGYILLRIIMAGGHSLWENIGLWYLLISLIDHSTMSNVDLDGYIKNVWIFTVPLFIFFLILGLLT